MKKLIFASIAMFSMAMEAQNISDAVRYSTTDLTGTARYRAMSGAFGALGGDLSALDVNPAGSAVFLRSFSSLSLGMNNVENEVSYLNGLTTSSEFNMDLGQAGAVFVFDNLNENSGWRKFTLGFNYNKTTNYDNNFMAFGTNTRSIDRYFLDYANGLALDLLVPRRNETPSDLYSYLGEDVGYGAQQAFLGYRGFIIEAEDPEDFDNTSYYSTIAPGSFDQEYSYAATGLNGKFSFNFATQFEDDLYLGINLNSHFLNYDRITTFLENNSNPGSEINEVYFRESLNTVGSGFSFQLGGIARLGDRVRLGASYESPTWYSISEETTHYLETYSEELGEAIVDPDVVNIYPDYTLQTPDKYTLSAAYVLGARGLFSFDYSYRDYSKTTFKPSGDPGLRLQNELMESELKGAMSWRAGGELRFGDLSVRGGYRMEGSPYEDENILADLYGFSLGLGYNFGGVRLDFAYDTADQERSHQLFETGLTDRARINQNNSNYTLTLSFGL